MTTKKKQKYFLPEIGQIEISYSRAGVNSVQLNAEQEQSDQLSTAPATPELDSLENWMKSYLSKKPLPVGGLKLDICKATDFQRKVWQTLTTIPFGETRTYKWVAEKIGNPKGVRAVGTACGANPLPLIIPCHRVVAEKNPGGWSGPRGWKEKLLDFEQKI